MGENAPPPDGWVCEPHAWNAIACCPPACMTTTVDDAIVLEIARAQAERWSGTLAILAEHDGDHITRGEN